MPRRRLDQVPLDRPAARLQDRRLVADQAGQVAELGDGACDELLVVRDRDVEAAASRAAGGQAPGGDLLARRQVRQDGDVGIEPLPLGTDLGDDRERRHDQDPATRHRLHLARPFQVDGRLAESGIAPDGEALGRQRQVLHDPPLVVEQVRGHRQARPGGRHDVGTQPLGEPRRRGQRVAVTLPVVADLTLGEPLAGEERLVGR
jgi:hypothetical protein